MHNRPPIGFIVEGQGEYNCYPSLLCRCVGEKGFNIPRINAGGYGGITKRLDEQLTDLCMLYSPLHVIVTIDLVDVIKAGTHINCESLLQFLSDKANDWLICTSKDSRIINQPESITVILQIQKFEAWIIADVRNLRKNKILPNTIPDISDADGVLDPALWLSTNLLNKRNIKNPNYAKELISMLNPDHMKKNSRSFNKFYREVSSKYNNWKEQCNSTKNN